MNLLILDSNVLLVLEAQESFTNSYYFNQHRKLDRNTFFNREREVA